MSVKIHEAFSLDSFQDRFLWFDHFLGDQLKDEWRSTGDAGGGVAVVDAQAGGIVRITTDTDDDDEWWIDWADIRSFLASKKITLEARIILASAASIKVVIALFNDATHLIMFEYDTDDADTNWQITTDDGTGPTTADSGEAVDTSYHILRIEAFPTGEAHFFIDDVECANSPITADIPPEYLQPYLFVQTRTTAAKTLDVDYIAARQER